MKPFIIGGLVFIAYIFLLLFLVKTPSNYKENYHKEILMYCRSEKPYGFNAKYGPEKCYSLIEIR